MGHQVARENYRENDALLRGVLADTIFSFGMNKRIFNSILAVSRLDKWQLFQRTINETSRYPLEDQDREEYLELTREAYRLAELRYRAGAVDFTTVLDAQRALLAAESAVDQTRFARFASLVGLYRALGGGWQDAPRRAGR